jgi:hypothetical protein
VFLCFEALKAVEFLSKQEIFLSLNSQNLTITRNHEKTKPQPKGA